MTTNQSKFIIVDDDPINNFLCEKIIINTIPNADVMAFTEPENGLAYLLATFSKPDSGNAILFLDINMPSMTGWEFMEELKKADASIKAKIHVYILSSSVNPVDKEKARINPDILKYIEKPLSVSVLEAVT